MFYIKANINNAKLRYVESWPTLDNIYGQFILDNVAIKVKADRAFINGNIIDKADVIIPNYGDENGVSLIANGDAHGETEKFMVYLRNSPINKWIGEFPEKINTSGNGKLKIYLNIPFESPTHTEVKGTYTFINNSINFLDMPVPPISDVNGDLNFTQYGIKSKGISVRALNSNAILKADTNEKTRLISFDVSAPMLDYNEVSRYYLPTFSHAINGKSASNIKFTIDKRGLSSFIATSSLQGVALDAPLDELEESRAKPMQLKLYPNGKHNYVLDWSIKKNLIKGFVEIDSNSHKVYNKIAIGGVGFLADASSKSLASVNVSLPVIYIDKWIAFVSSLFSHGGDKVDHHIDVADHKPSGNLRDKYKLLPLEVEALSPQFMLGNNVLGNGTLNLIADSTQTSFNFNTPITNGSGNFIYESQIINLNIDKYKINKASHNGATESSINTKNISFVNGSSERINSKIPNINFKINNLYFQDHNLGTVGANIKHKGQNLYLDNGLLSNNDMSVNFKAVNYCFGCGARDSYVELNANTKIKDFGNVIESLDFGRVLTGGNGNANIILQWNGGFQDFGLLKMVGSVKGHLYSGKFTKIDPGLLGSIFSIINMQSLFEFSSGDVRDIFEKGFYFNSADVDLEIMTSKLEVKKLTIDGPTASLKSLGIIDFASNSIRADVAISPKVGFAIAVAAGIATLNPLVGLVVYGAEFITDDVQNKLLTMRYYISGDLHKPKMERSDAKNNLYKNMNSTIGLD
ncbi:MAG: DUF3971 domain-containing protein, partial [Burkholderiales bacterium]|nr:DUF3971 domain-containing protein [Burkholderiales bacterium]